MYSHSIFKLAACMFKGIVIAGSVRQDLFGILFLLALQPIVSLYFAAL